MPNHFPLEYKKSIADYIQKDPKSWRDWYALYFVLPSQTSIDDGEDCISLLTMHLKKLLETDEGLIFSYSSHDLIALIHTTETRELLYIGDQVSEYALMRINLYPSYNIYSLGLNSSDFIELIHTRFGLGRGSPSPRSSSSHLRLDENKAIPPQFQNRVLLIEDDPSTRWLVRTALKGHCDLMTSDNASAGFSIIQKYDPDLIFLDIGLPDYSGQKLLEMIKEVRPKQRVIMFTNDARFDSMMEAFDAGADGYIQKPFHRFQLIDYL